MQIYEIGYNFSLFFLLHFVGVTFICYVFVFMDDCKKILKALIVMFYIVYAFIMIDNFINYPLKRCKEIRYLIEIHEVNYVEGVVTDYTIFDIGLIRHGKFKVDGVDFSIYSRATYGFNNIHDNRIRDGQKVIIGYIVEELPYDDVYNFSKKIVSIDIIYDDPILDNNNNIEASTP